jgi:hypothetical protein
MKKQIACIFAFLCAFALYQSPVYAAMASVEKMCDCIYDTNEPQPQSCNDNRCTVKDKVSELVAYQMRVFGGFHNPPKNINWPKPSSPPLNPPLRSGLSGC